MRRTSIAASLAALALAAPALVAGAEDPTVAPDGTPVCDDSPLAFPTRATRLGDGGRGYEPSIEIDSQGTIFVTAHKQSLVMENRQTSSWLWRSTDGGRTFEDMQGLMGVTQLLYALEGDLAVDGNDRLYFVDTWAADNHVYRFSEAGATLDQVRPAVLSAEVDDRPWLAAHGDGYVYYLSNTGYTPDGRLTVHRSTDGGTTFDPVGFTFPDSGWGFLDADPNSEYVYAVMDDLFYGTGLLGSATQVGAWISPDRGESWEYVKIADYEVGNNSEGYPTVAVSPVDGSLAALWGDGHTMLKLARSFDHGATWTVHDITPFEGDYAHPWVTIGPDGDIGVIFSAGDTSAVHHVYALLFADDSDCLTDADDPASLCTGPATRYDAMHPKQVGDRGSQAHFFQAEFHPDDDSFAVPYTNAAQGGYIDFVRQLSGPNMADRPFCGHTGSRP